MALAATNVNAKVLGLYNRRTTVAQLKEQVLAGMLYKIILDASVSYQPRVWSYRDSKDVSFEGLPFGQTR